ncbi:MAG: hypothetical protein ACR2JG_10040 [Geodermatophilaceae bacterium]
MSLVLPVLLVGRHVVDRHVVGRSVVFMGVEALPRGLPAVRIESLGSYVLQALSGSIEGLRCILRCIQDDLDAWSGQLLPDPRDESFEQIAGPRHGEDIGVGW